MGNWMDILNVVLALLALGFFMWALRQRAILRRLESGLTALFRVRYTDEDNDAPTVAKLMWTKGSDWKTEDLTEYDTTDKDYTDGKIYSFRKKFGTGDWKYHFQFRNSVHPEKTTNDVQFKVEEPPGLFPGPNAVMVMGALLTIAIVTVVTSRGRKQQRL